jgi:hypothetical protein
MATWMAIFPVMLQSGGKMVCVGGRKTNGGKYLLTISTVLFTFNYLLYYFKAFSKLIKSEKSEIFLV